MSNPTRIMTVTELEAIVDTHGADMERWPASGLASARELLATSAEARRIVAEAQALDALLDRAPTVTVGRESALAERIMAAAAREPVAPRFASTGLAQSKPSATVTPLRRPVPMTSVARGPAAALLAASLVLGMVVGSSGITASATSYIADALGLTDDEAEVAFAIDGRTGGDDTL